MKNIIKITTLGLLLLVAHACCAPDADIDNPCGARCQIYEVCKDGTCQCEEGRIKINSEATNCFEIREDHYYAKIDSCFCIGGQLLIEARKSPVNIDNFYDLELWTEDRPQETLTYGSYYKKPDGDSIVAYDVFLRKCEINNIPVTIMFTLKFKGNDTLDGYLIWYNPPAPFAPNARVDSCKITFTKLKK